MSYGYLIHSAGPWKQHKYIKKVGNRYYYGDSGSQFREDPNPRKAPKAELGKYDSSDPDWIAHEKGKSKDLAAAPGWSKLDKVDGSVVLFFGDTKYTLPKGTEINEGFQTDLGNQLAYAVKHNIKDPEKKVNTKPLIQNIINYHLAELDKKGKLDRSNGSAISPSAIRANDKKNEKKPAISPTAVNASEKRRNWTSTGVAGSGKRIWHSDTNESHGYLIHSTGLWKKHKYIKKIGDRYYYKGEHLPSGAEYNEYDENDPDQKYFFSDDFPADKHRLGNTDFFGFTGANGRDVILEEDMKWTLPEGVKISPELVKNLEKFSDEVGKLSDSGDWTAEKWQTMAQRAIDSSIHPGDNKGESRSLDEMAKAVIRGEYGNGAERKEALGENYAEIQKRVNEMMKGGGSSSSSKSSSSSSGKQISPTAINAADKNIIKKNEESRDQRVRNAYKARSIKHSDDYLEHFGILGMHWGIRRFQNKDGSLTSAGKQRYGAEGGDYNKGNQPNNSNQAYNSGNGNHNSGGNSNNSSNSDSQIRALQNQIDELKQLVKQQNQQNQQNSSRSELDELQNAVRRLELEKRYRELSQPQPQQQNNQNDRTKELEVMVRTMELEQRYNDLVSKKNQKKDSAGKKFVKDVMLKAGTAVAVSALTYGMGKAVNKVLGEDVISLKGGGNKSSNKTNPVSDIVNAAKNSGSGGSSFKITKPKTRSLFTKSMKNSALSNTSLSNLSTSVNSGKNALSGMNINSRSMSSMSSSISAGQSALERLSMSVRR